MKFDNMSSSFFSYVIRLIQVNSSSYTLFDAIIQYYLTLNVAIVGPDCRLYYVSKKKNFFLHFFVNIWDSRVVG